MAEIEVIGAGNRFALDLLAQANRPDDNLFVSPLSASMALGMSMNGAAGETWSQMRGGGGLDFASPSASVRINEWVKAATQGRIEDIVPAAIPANVLMYLINAIYFKGSWTFRFDPSDTRDEPFHLDDGSTRTVPLMTLRETLP